MPLVPAPAPAFRAVLFDLDEALLSCATAWAYTVEQAVLTICGARVSAAALAGEYRTRPWRDALGVVLDDPAALAPCEAMCRAMFLRSSMKKLTVHDGLGMALDCLRGARVEVGAVSREPHATALKQVQSTGLDRFLSVLSATPEGVRWDLAGRLDDCLRFLEQGAAACAFVSSDAFDLQGAQRRGFACYVAGWADPDSEAPAAFPRFERPAELALLLR